MATWAYEVPDMEYAREIIISSLETSRANIAYQYGDFEYLTRCRDCQMHAKTGMCLFFGKFTRDDDYCSQAREKDA